MSEKGELQWLPNAVTLFRIFIVPLFVAVFYFSLEHANIWALVLFSLAAISDWLDGYLARAYHSESSLGKLLDPLADKILVVAALVILVSPRVENQIPAWIVIALLSREMAITGLRSFATTQGIVVGASNWAKHKTAWTMIAIISLLLADREGNFFGMKVDYFFSGVVFLYIALVLSIATGLGYARALRKLF